MGNPQTTKVKGSDLNCATVRDDLHSYLMNELSEGEFRDVSAHLATCAACRSALREHVELFGMLRENADLLSRLLDDGAEKNRFG
jgi:anti-sigma factor RsiW